MTLYSPFSRLSSVRMNTPGPCRTASIGHTNVGSSRFSQPLPGSVPSNLVQSSPPSSAPYETAPFAQPREGPHCPMYATVYEGGQVWGLKGPQTRFHTETVHPASHAASDTPHPLVSYCIRLGELRPWYYWPAGSAVTISLTFRPSPFASIYVLPGPGKGRHILPLAARQGMTSSLVCPQLACEC